MKQPNDKKRIMEAPTPNLAKSLGRQASLRSDWEQEKDDVMRKALYQKAQQCKEFRELLKSTGQHILIEASPFDSYWGEGRPKDGLNRLGELLMELRSTL